jgi:hypothetical protein
MDAVIGLGSNLGPRLEHLRTAVEALAALGVIRARSAIYETAPVGGPPQPEYLNAAIWLRTDLSPLSLLTELWSMSGGPAGSASLRCATPPGRSILTCSCSGFTARSCWCCRS